MSFLARMSSRHGHLAAVRAARLPHSKASPVGARIFSTGFPCRQQPPSSFSPSHHHRAPVKPSGYQYNPPPAPQASPLPLSTPPAPPRARSLRLYLAALAVGAVLGYLSGQAAVAQLFRLNDVDLAPDSPEAREAMLETAAEGDFLVETLLYQLGPGWAAVKPSGSGLCRALSGDPEALPYQCLVYDEATGDVLNVFYLGERTAGWPHVVHGGAAATILEETMGYCAGLGAAIDAAHPPGSPHPAAAAAMDLSYKSPLITGAWFIAFATSTPDTPPSHRHHARRAQGDIFNIEYLDDAFDIRDVVAAGSSVTAHALFVLPKTPASAGAADLLPGGAEEPGTDR